MHSKALIIAAHPDDEVLGCGGTIAKLTSQNIPVQVAFLADGVSSRTAGEIDRKELQRRHTACAKACAILGACPPEYGNFPDNQMDTVSLLSIAQAIEALIRKHTPDILFTHHGGDVNVDHQLVHQAAVTACRPQIGMSVKTLLFFETMSSTEWQTPGSAPVFAPNWFEEISTHLQRKLNAMSAYQDEIRDWPHPRSLRGIEALCRWRGATIGVDAAEAFVVGRHLG